MSDWTGGAAAKAEVAPGQRQGLGGDSIASDGGELETGEVAARDDSPEGPVEGQETLEATPKRKRRPKGGQQAKLSHGQQRAYRRARGGELE